jgi:hypothetical protein
MSDKSLDDDLIDPLSLVGAGVTTLTAALSVYSPLPCQLVPCSFLSIAVIPSFTYYAISIQSRFFPSDGNGYWTLTLSSWGVNLDEEIDLPCLLLFTSLQARHHGPDEFLRVSCILSPQSQIYYSPLSDMNSHRWLNMWQSFRLFSHLESYEWMGDLERQVISYISALRCDGQIISFC